MIRYGNDLLFPATRKQGLAKVCDGKTKICYAPARHGRVAHWLCVEWLKHGFTMRDNAEDKKRIAEAKQRYATAKSGSK